MRVRGWLKQLNPVINGLTGSEYNCVIPGNTSSKCVTVSKGGYDTGPDDPGIKIHINILFFFLFNKSIPQYLRS